MPRVAQGTFPFGVPVFQKKFFFSKTQFPGLFLTLITNLTLFLPSEAYSPRYCQLLPRFSKKFFLIFSLKNEHLV